MDNERVEEDFLGSAIRFRMNINNNQMASSASQPLSGNTHNEASITQLIAPGLLPSSQPLLISDQSRAEIVTRRREARRPRRRRRTTSRHRPLAQQIRRRQMTNQYRQQEQYYRNGRTEERERHEREDQDRHDYIRRRPTAFNEHNEEVIEERLQEVYDWEIMQLMQGSEREQLYELEGVAALERLSSVQDQMEQSSQLQAVQALDEEEQQLRERAGEASTQTEHNDIEDHSTTQSLDSIIYHMYGMQPIDDIEKPTETNLPNLFPTGQR